jgi:hypothetical protein
MADFASLATSYVLADEEDEQQRLAGQAADGEYFELTRFHFQHKY